MEQSKFHNKSIKINGISISLVEGGDAKNPAILFLHGYPETSNAFLEIMGYLKGDYHVLAIDLPGIGKSDPINQHDKLSIASLIRDMLAALDIPHAAIAGHDIGGMVVYSLIKNFPGVISKAIILCTAVPGVKPWEDVKRNPFIWHFSFYAVPELPEKLIQGREDILFDYFYDTISFNSQAIKKEDRKNYVEAYNSPKGLKSALGWYRAFPQDEKINQANTRTVETPVLYLKGEKDFGSINNYIQGFRESGLKNIEGKTVPGSAHFVHEENPSFTAKSIADFLKG